jgi:hypothetical protein
VDLIKGIAKKSFAGVLAAAALSAVAGDRRLTAGIVAGGLLGYFNIKGLAWGVHGLLGSGKATGRLIFFSMFRLFLLFAALAVLVYLKAVNVFGLLIGFTIVFTALLIEGLKNARQSRPDIPEKHG